MKISKLHLSFNAQEDSVPFHRNFNSILRKDHQKISYERRANESVDKNSRLSLVVSPKKTTKKNLVHKGVSFEAIEFHSADLLDKMKLSEKIILIKYKKL